MSKLSTPVDEALFDFIRDRTLPEDELLRELREAALAADLPEIHIAPEQAAFLQITLAAARAETVIEVGTLGGYSAISMARGLPAHGRVITHEIDPKHADFARAWIERSDQRGKIEVRVGDARETLAKIGDGSADAVFLDADKEGYTAYLEHAMRILRPGGILFADNVLASGRVHDRADRSATPEAIRAFLERVGATADLRAVIVPLGDGCLFGVKSRS